MTKLALVGKRRFNYPNGFHVGEWKKDFNLKIQIFFFLLKFLTNFKILGFFLKVLTFFLKILTVSLEFRFLSES